jgi:hypothetical protein
MTKRFCDLCQKEMSPKDDVPFIRHINTVVVSLIVTNEHLHAINDVCNDCKVSVVTEGAEGIPKKEVATLQSPVKSPPIVEHHSPIQVFRAAEPPQFEPSAPAKTATPTDASSSDERAQPREQNVP